MDLDDLLRTVESGETKPVYLVEGELVVAEPRAARLAEALAGKAGCKVERYRRPARLTPILTDLKTYSLFASAKVVLVVDAAILTDSKAAADLIDQAAEGLPLGDDGGELDTAGREAASRLLQALRVFGVEPRASSEETIGALPKWALEGGTARRKKKTRGRSKKDVTALCEGLVALLDAALEAGLQGFAEGELAELGEVVRKGLPEGHSLVLAEASVAADHPVRQALVEAGTFLQVGKVSASRGGDWQGLEPLAEELARESGTKIARDALAELARRTLRQAGSWGDRGVDAQSTGRFAAEYRKLSSLAGGGTISRRLVEESVEDRGEQDVWQILDALGKGQGGEAVGRFQRLLASADDQIAARLSFFALLARFCRELAAVAGMAKITGVAAGERNYNRFKDRLAPRLQGEIPEVGGRGPLSGIHPFRLHRAYLTASSMPREAFAQLPWWVLETELRVKGDSREADAAIIDLMGRLVQLVRS